jgi:hypothetical protein
VAADVNSITFIDQLSIMFIFPVALGGLVL